MTLEPLREALDEFSALDPEEFSTLARYDEAEQFDNEIAPAA